MAVVHRQHPVVGVQFHPESAASQYGYVMLDRFLRGDAARVASLPSRADGAGEPVEPVQPWTGEAKGFFDYSPPPVERVR
jgi:hypothetical protein